MLKWICLNLYIFLLSSSIARWHTNLVVFVPACGPLRSWSTESKRLTANHLPDLHICRMPCLRHRGTVQLKCCEQPHGQTAVQDRACLVLQEGKRHTSVLPSAGCGLLWAWWLCDSIPLMALNLERHHWFSFILNTVVIYTFMRPMQEDSWTSRRVTLAFDEPKPPP